jgi:serine/threonine-protein kinase
VGEGAIEVYSFKTGKRKTLVQMGAYARFLPSGHLVYFHRGTLFVAPMDPSRLELTGPSVPVPEDVSFEGGTGTAEVTFSSGIFAYVAMDPQDRMRPIGLLDENGKWSRCRCQWQGSRILAFPRMESASQYGQ